MHDVVVVGGSYAGMAAALQLARARKDVVIVDAGKRRNRFATHSHGFLGNDGAEGAAIAANAKRQLLAYPTVTWIEGAVRAARGASGSFVVTLEDDRRLETARIVLALGVVDELPPIDGIAERWGRSVFHCPYCHGYELDGGPIGVIANSSLSVHHAAMLPDWGETTYFTRGFTPTPDEQALLEQRGVAIEPSAVVAVEGPDHAPAVRLADGRVRSFRGLFVASKIVVASRFVAELGCAFEDGPAGAFVKTDPMTKQTTVPGVFACGDMAIAAGSVSLAVGDGVRAGMAAHRSLIFPATPTPPHPTK